MLPSSPTTRSWIESTLKEKLNHAEVRVEDTTGTDDHFQALIITEEFEGLNTVKRHRLIYQALGDAMRERVHALSLTTLTPEEYTAKSS